MKLQLLSRSDRTHHSVFNERYEWLLSWALKLTRGDRAEAEDILHDAYIQFLRLAPALDSIDNTDAYLNRIVRNLHLSRLMRRTRFPVTQLDAVDYDSAALSVEAVDPFKLLPLQQQLQTICDWCCERRTETKAASVLLLRYFLGYLPSEICKVCQCNRQSVEKSLQLARREIRQWDTRASGPQSSRERQPALRAGGPLPRFITAPGKYTEIELSLLSTIFHSPVGECLPPLDLRTHYQGDTLSRTMLAHLTSCELCLDSINRHLGLPTLAERSMMQGNDRSDHPKDPKPPSSGDRLASRADQTVKKIFEHRPVKLAVHVDGERRGSMGIQAIDNEFELEVGRNRSFTFVEVFSEQNVRLIYMPVFSPEEGGEYLQESAIALSEDRSLRVQVCMSQPRPTISLTYSDPLFRGMHTESDADLRIAPIQRSEALEPSKNIQPDRGVIEKIFPGLQRFLDTALKLPFRTLPRAVTFATSLVLIITLTVWQTRSTTLQAETLLVYAGQWQSSRMANKGEVLHRSFDYYEHPHTAGSAMHRRVEIWRSSNRAARLSRLYDDSGKLIATSADALNGQPVAGDAWQYEPSAASFKLAAADAAATATQSATEFEIRTPQIELDLDKASYRPTGEVLHFADRDIELRERSTESLPLEQTPLAELQTMPAMAPSLHAAEHFHIDLNLTEMLVRSRLHAMQADLGEDIRIAQTAQGITVSGIVTPEDRRLQLVAGLKDLPGVAVQLQSPEQALNREPSKIRRVVDQSNDVLTAPLLNDWLKNKYPDESERSTAVEHTLALADQCMWRARALDQLAQRYGGFTDPTVHAIAADHLHALQESVRSLQQWAAILPADDSGTAFAASDSTSAVETTHAIARSSQEMEQNLAELLTAHSETHTGSSPSVAQALTRYRRYLAELDALSKKIS